jgi:zinc transport system ATP-binding protein
MERKAVIEVKDLTVSFRGREVLESINLTVFNDDFMGLIGPNGAGKTVFLKTLLGLISPDSGSISILGAPPKTGRKAIGYVPQYAQFDNDFPITVLSVVLMGRLGSGVMHYSAADKEAALQAIEMVELQDLAAKHVGNLSGGQLQRVLIARAIVSNPQVLLLDEPTASLDTRVGRGFYEMLEGLSKSMAIILVSHDIGVISTHVKTIACLNRRLHYHNTKELSSELMEEVYGCPFELIGHGHAHRVLGGHQHDHCCDE